MWPRTLLSLFFLTSSCILAAPVAQESTETANTSDKEKSDLPVEQLQNLKLKEAAESNHKESSATGAGSAHLEYHSIDAVKENGELVSRLEQHASADAAPGSPPDVHTHVILDVPAAGVHRDIQDGDVSAHEATTPVNDEPTTKVFHGAARLIQTGAATNLPQQSAHTAVRRAYNADITKETQNNMDHYSPYAGVQYSPLDMAEYVFWTGDEKGVTVAIEEFLQEGLMSKEEAINFLQEIKMNIDYLRSHYRQNMKAAEESDKLRTLLIEQANAKESYQNRPAGLQRLPFANTPEIIRNIQNKNWEMSNSLTPTYPILPVASDLRPESVKRTYHADPMMQTNIIGTSDFERDGGSMITEEEYEEMMEKLKAADSLYTEYTLEEIIYQLAKMMFSQSLTRDPREARAAIQRFMTFLELEAERGQLSRSIEKKVLDVMVAALTDTIGDHPELMQGRDQGMNSFNSGNRLMRQFLDSSVSSPGVSRAILAAYKDELLKGPPMHKLAFNERN